jgi:hypothetical protein
MRLYELFEDPFTPAGMTYTINDKQDEPAAGQGNANVASGFTTNANVASNTNTNSGIGSGNTTNSTISPNASQMLSKGSSVTLPMGPSKQPTQLKVTNISNDNSNNSEKMVTVSDPNKPDQPSQTYKFKDLAAILGNKGNI